MDLRTLEKAFEQEGQAWAKANVAAFLSRGFNFLEMVETESSKRAESFEVLDPAGGRPTLSQEQRQALWQAFYRGAQQGYFQFEPCRVWLLTEEPEQYTPLFDLIREQNGYPDGNVLLVRDDGLSDERRAMLRAADTQQRDGVAFRYYGDEDEVQYDFWCGWPSRCFGLVLAEPVDPFKPDPAPSPRG